MTARAWLRRHPELSVLLLSVIAWIWLLVPANVGLPGLMTMTAAPTPARTPGASRAMRMPAAGDSMHMTGMGATMNMPSMSGPMVMPGMSDASPGAGRADARSRVPHSPTMSGWTLPMFLVMAIAMMLPTTTGSIRGVAGRSMWRRRRRAIGEWIVGYVAAWALAGAVVLSARSATVDAGLFTPGPLPLVVGLLLAAVWQLTPPKRRALNGCHGTRPLRPGGVRADRDCLLWGASIGRECVMSCGPMMIAMTLGHGDALLVTVGVTLVALAERFRHRPPRRTSAVALALLAAAAV